MTLVDVIPVVAVAIVGVVCGRFLSGRWAWLVALEVPAVLLLVSLVTPRPGEDLWRDVAAMSILLFCVTALGVLIGDWLRARQRTRW